MQMLLTVLLLLAIAVALARLLFFHRELREMTRAIRAIHGQKTNRQLRVSSQNRAIAELANAVNALYDDIYTERREHAHAVEEMRRNMANISHDLRTPLTSILGYLSLLQRGDNTPVQGERYLAVACDKAAALSRMVESLFLLAKLDAGAYHMSMERLDAAGILAEELAGFYEVFRAGKAPPDIRLSGEPLPIWADRLALSRVFGNLLQNIERHGAGGVQITGGRQGDQAVFRFQNDAPTLREGEEEQLFRRFFTGDRARGGENTGLGLAIVKEFVEGMGGDIRAEIGRGVLTFTLCWKLCP